MEVTVISQNKNPVKRYTGIEDCFQIYLFPIMACFCFCFRSFVQMGKYKPQYFETFLLYGEGEIKHL